MANNFRGLQLFSAHCIAVHMDLVALPLAKFFLWLLYCFIRLHALFLFWCYTIDCHSTPRFRWDTFVFQTFSI